MRAVRGVIVTSGKPSFIAGYDLTEFLRSFGPHLTAAEAYDRFSGSLQAIFRRIETCGKPWVAAINGLALGGGFELCLACHYRVMADDPKVFVGLPEVKVGLLPGGGGTQRMPRLIGITQALPYLLEGGNIVAREAKKLGLVHEIVPPAELIAAARKRWLLGTPSAVQPWDQKGFKVPGGVAFDEPGRHADVHGRIGAGGEEDAAQLPGAGRDPLQRLRRHAAADRQGPRHRGEVLRAARHEPGVAQPDPHDVREQGQRRQARRRVPPACRSRR